MKKEKFKEYEMLDTEQMNLEDNIDKQGNQQWRLRNEIGKIGLSIGRDQKQLTLGYCSAITWFLPLFCFECYSHHIIITGGAIN